MTGAVDTLDDLELAGACSAASAPEVLVADRVGNDTPGTPSTLASGPWGSGSL